MSPIISSPKVTEGDELYRSKIAGLGRRNSRRHRKPCEEIPVRMTDTGQVIYGKDCDRGGDRCTDCGGQGADRRALMIEASSAEISNLGAIPNGHSLLTLRCAATCRSQGHSLQVASPKAAAVLVIAAKMSASVIRNQE